MVLYTLYLKLSTVQIQLFGRTNFNLFACNCNVSLAVTYDPYCVDCLLPLFHVCHLRHLGALYYLFIYNMSSWLMHNNDCIVTLYYLQHYCVFVLGSFTVNSFFFK
jgi:hypothetical protein